ncbi:hypothetical protein Tco_1567226, partial [Tanacetum coccineum]
IPLEHHIPLRPILGVLQIGIRAKVIEDQVASRIHAYMSCTILALVDYTKCLHRLAMSSDNASSAVTYTSISSDSNGSSWGIPLVNVGELPEMDPYEELEELIPVYVPEPEHPEYHVPLDDDMQVEDQPYADDASPTAESPGYITDSDSMKENTDEDFIDYPDEPEDDDEDPEEDDDEDPEEDP